MKTISKIFAAGLAVAGLALAPVAWADDDDWGDDPGGDVGDDPEPDSGTEEWCIWNGGHDIIETVDEEPTCTEFGHASYECANCGMIWDDDIPPLGHDYVNGVCSRCGQIQGGQSITYTHVEAVAPTCTTEGNIEYWLGSNNLYYNRPGGNVLSASQVFLSALNHNWGSWMETTPATCTGAGEATRTCSRCDASETQTIAARGHRWGQWTETTPATCTEAGVITRTCSRAGCDASETQPIAALGHSWGQWTVTTPATYQSDGVEERSCSRSGCTGHETRSIPMLLHSTFTLKSSTSGSTTTFSIFRSGDTTNIAETVLYRTASLSALAGVHFTAVTGTLTFAAGETNRTVAVTEKPIGNISTLQYRYQTGTSRSYRFEVDDRDGTEFVHTDHSISYGSSYQFKADKVSAAVTNLVYFNGTSFASGLASSKYAEVSYTPPSSDVDQSGTYAGYALIDDSYSYTKKAATVSTANLIGTTGVSASYLNTLEYKIYATVCFTMKEKNDGYQFVQILTGDSSAAYDGADGNAKVDNPVNSLYKACFELKKGSGVYSGDGKQFYPHRYDYADRSAGGQTSSNTEFYLDSGYLWQHKFKDDSYRASTSGSVILPANTSYITTRFDCCGGDNDTWGYKDFFVRMALVDASAPTLLNSSNAAIAVDPGPHYKGGAFYISVPFSEIVNASGASLVTSWGTASYVAGNGSNVLTFKGTINHDEGTMLKITGRNGTIKDLVGNAFSGSCAKTFTNTVVETVPWSGTGTEADPYMIVNASQLNLLAARVNGGNHYINTYFALGADTAYSCTSAWNVGSTENNYAAIGGYGHSFQGKFDGNGHIVSGIRIYRSGTADTDGSQGLFGFLSSGGSVKNVILADARITGHVNCGAIVGYNDGTLATNYYRNVSVNGVTTNIGTGTSGDLPGARSVHTLVLADGISLASADGSVTITNVTYYAANATNTLAYGGTPPHGYTFASYKLNGVDLDGDTFTMPAADSSITASYSPIPFPAYLDDAPNNIQSNYVAWAAQYGPDVDGTHEAAFLLNINPAMPIPDGAALLKVVDFYITSTNFHLELASDVAPLTQPFNLLGGSPELCNGFLVVDLSPNLASLSLNKLTLPVPVSVDANGHAVIDIGTEELLMIFSYLTVPGYMPEMPEKLFIRPVLTPNYPDVTQILIPVQSTRGAE